MRIGTVSRHVLLLIPGFPTPPSEPDVQFSLHPALHLSVNLSFLPVTVHAQGPEVIGMIGVDRQLEASVRLDVIDFGCFGGDYVLAKVAGPMVTFQNGQPHVGPSRPVFRPYPRIVIREDFPEDRGSCSVGIRFLEAFLVLQGSKLTM